MTISRLAFRSSAVACAVFGARMFISVPAAAEDAAPEEAWKGERRKLEQVIEERVKEEIDKNVTDKQVAEQLGMKWPVQPPPKTKEEIAAAVETEVDADAAVKYPDSKRKEFETEANEKYRVYERGDLVDFSIRDGKGPNSQVKGRLYDKTTMRLKIGSRYVLRTDMDEETTACFWEDVSEEYKNKYIRVQNMRYDAKINAYKEARRKVRLPQALEAARYILDPRVKPGTIKLERWFAESDVLQYFCEKRRKAFEEEIRPNITEQVFTSNGFVMVEDTVNKTKEWMPKQEAASFRDKLKALLEQKKEEEEAAKESARNPGMMGGQPGMMGGQPGMMGGQPGMMGPGMMGGQPGTSSGMSSGGKPGMMGPGMMGPGMMGPGAGGGKPAAGAGAPAADKTPFDEGDPW